MVKKEWEFNKEKKFFWEMIIFLKKLMLKPLNQISSIMIVIPKSFSCPLSNRSTIKLLMIIMI